MGAAAEGQSAAFQKKNLAEIRASLAKTTAQMNFNNRILKERLHLIRRINQAITSAQQQLIGGFQNALMYSGVALMGFGFRLQGVISDFMAFEK